VDFLHLAVAVGDHPVAREQLGAHLAGVEDGDVVGEHEVLVLRARLVGDVFGDRGHLDAVRRGLAHRLLFSVGKRGRR